MADKGNPGAREGATGAGLPCHAAAAGFPTIAQANGREKRAGLHRIIARRVPWPDLATKPGRAGLRLRWDALSAAGELLAAATECPLADGAHVLAERGLHPETLVTLRHEGAGHDSFLPMPLRVPAARGAMRAEGSARIAARFARGSQRTPEAGPVRPTGCPDAHGLPLAMPDGARTGR